MLIKLLYYAIILIIFGIITYSLYWIYLSRLSKKKYDLVIAFEDFKSLFEQVNNVDDAIKGKNSDPNINDIIFNKEDFNFEEILKQIDKNCQGISI